MLHRQVLSVYGQLNPGIWSRTPELGPISQAKRRAGLEAGTSLLSP